MAIGRLHFPEGARLCEYGGDMVGGLERVLEREIGNMVIMAAGTKMITPDVWTKNTHNYFVTAHEDGTGSFYRIARQGIGEIENLTNVSDEVLARLQTGEPMDAEHLRINQIIGPHPRHADMRVFEIVQFVPDELAIRLPREQIEPPRG